MSERSGAVRRHRAAGATRQTSARPRILVAVAALVALLLVVGALSEPTRPAPASLAPVAPSAMPVVSMSRVAAWQCPGPLPVGEGAERSAIVVANLEGAKADVAVSVVRVAVPAAARHEATGGATRRPSGTGLVQPTPAITTARRTLPSRSQTFVPLSTSGAAGVAAVSVEASTPGIAVQEVVSGPKGRFASPCATGSSVAGYLPVGTTFGTSSVEVALFNPTETPAVADVSVASGTPALPVPAFQGIVLPGRALAILDMGRWLPQRKAIAVAVRATEGQVTVGALESSVALVDVASGTGSGHQLHTVRLTGGALLLGAQSPSRTLGFAAGPVSSGVSDVYAVFANLSAPVGVSIAPTDPAGKASAITEQLPPGGAGALTTPPPVRGSPPWSSLVLHSSGGAGFAAARSSLGISPGPLHGLSVTEASLGPAASWLLLASGASTGASSAARAAAAGDLVLANPLGRPVTVEVRALGQAGPVAGPATQLVVPANGSRAVPLRRVASTLGDDAVVVAADGPVFAERSYTVPGAPTQFVAGLPIVR